MAPAGGSRFINVEVGLTNDVHNALPAVVN